MKINPIAQQNAIQQYNSAKIQRTPETNKPAQADRVTLSDEALRLSSEIRALKAEFKIRSSAENEHVKAVADLVKSGRYQVDSKAIAEKILRRFSD